MSDEDLSDFNGAERWMLRNRNFSAVLVIALVMGCLGGKGLAAVLQRQVDQVEAQRAQRVKERHRQLDEWIAAHHDELRSVCRRDNCKCSDIYQDPGESPVVAVHEKLEIKDGQVLCMVP